MGANMLGRHWHISQGDVKGGAGQEASGGLLAQDYFALWGEGVSSRTDLQSSALPPRSGSEIRSRIQHTFCIPIEDTLFAREKVYPLGIHLASKPGLAYP